MSRVRGVRAGNPTPSRTGEPQAPGEHGFNKTNTVPLRTHSCLKSNKTLTHLFIQQNKTTTNATNEIKT